MDERILAGSITILIFIISILFSSFIILIPFRIQQLRKKVMEYEELEKIEKIIEEQYDLLKPELKDKFIFRTTDEESNDYANTIYTNPPIITFYVKNIITMTDKPIKQSIRELITHELIHVLQVPGYENHKENEAMERFQKLNFFNDSSR